MKSTKKSAWVIALSFALLLLLTGCTATLGDAKITASTSQGQNEDPDVAAAAPNGAAAADNGIDYAQYVKKTWVRNTDADFPVGLSFVISNMEDGQIHGKLSAVGKSPAYNQDTAEFEGTVNNDTAQAQLVNDSRGNNGTIQITFLPNNTLEATIALTGKSDDPVMTIPEGTFEFAPYNLKNIEGFALIENQTFMTDLDSWGNVQFVSGKLTAGDHVPVEFYLTNKDGDILYMFNATLPYSVDVNAVSFVDVNKDGLKDIIIIVADNEGGPAVATVYLQQADGSFANDYQLDQEINDSGNNKDIGAITSYLSGKF
jgi:hypothetical protein